MSKFLIIFGRFADLEKFSPLITDRVRSTWEGYVLTRVCPSINLSIHTQGGTSARSSWGGGGVPHLGYLPIRPGRGGYPTSGTPPSYLAGGGGGTLMGGYPTSGTPPGPGQGYPDRGVPHLRYPPVRPGQGGTRWRGGWYPTSGST